jgi:septal ring factor EnvC (AmiA/AmiB activator)
MKFSRKTIKKSFLIIALPAFLTVFFSSESLGRQDVSEYQKRLTEISEQIKQIRAKMEKEEKKESTILSSLDKIGFNKKLIKKELSLYALQFEEANRALYSIKKNIPELKAKLDEEKETIDKILVTMYKFGKFNPFQFILQVENMGTYISESKHLSLLAQYQEKIISNYLETLTLLKATEEKQETKKKDISRLIQDTRKKRQELEAQERKSKALIEEIKKNRTMYLQTLEELRERTEQLQALINKLQNEEISIPVPIIPLYEKKGKLPWPISGRVTSSFGEKRHPRFNTITKNNGIEISPAENSIFVKSIHPGKVVFADYFQGYGNLIIIDHGMSYHSLYGHCLEFLIKKGDIVEAEQPIARVGDFGSLEGISLYFEIRYKTKPLNPLQWLKR